MHPDLKLIGNLFNLKHFMTTYIKMDISGMRKPYGNKQTLFLEKDIKLKDPIALFEEWFKLVKENPNTVEANAMCVSTANKNGIPSARYCLLKGYSKDGFIFFTHYTSRKGKELEENPYAALTFYWDQYNRSVRIEGCVEKLPFSYADEYFSKRPYRSQIGALCSDQSKPVESREILEKQAKELETKYQEGQVPRPPQWGGYIVKPTSFEFWQGQTDRIHDRIIFRKPNENEPDGKLSHQAADGWIYERLNP
ncbi:pyridoxine-5'-phosphate oxidase-like isoform X2 [Diorhabda carinulata]|uniref:pyridoxine-5'-phosphate oxidase-like isoform X2 n=1 Tax=Diorhabda carinulata TaxID=1163345 RepID=UPI0025A1ACDD|nr:pyridoxine-5'-phosphate oxidase-like isoform X2 [Diorhabda carinulata]